VAEIKEGPPRRLLEAAYDRIEELEDEQAAERKRYQRDLQSASDVTAELVSQRDEAVADKQVMEGRAANLAATVRNIVNDPLMARDQVQGRLLVALEKYDGVRR
jgi:hypothetical protein